MEIGKRGSWTIYLKSILEILPVPSLEEQQKINTYIDNLDSLITFHQQKNDTLKEIKNFMLQNMFPEG